MIRKFLTMLLKIRRKIRLRPTTMIIAMFGLIILTGAVLLNLPIASRDGQSIGFLDALFTATSAGCVTGLIVADTYQQWSYFGQLVILALIQIGGLGFMTMATLVSLFFRRTITYRERLLMAESLNQNHTTGIVRMTQHILIGTFILEATGALLLSINFIPRFGVVGGIYRGIFHSVSSFCNAGFDLMGKHGAFSSLTEYQPNVVVNIVIMGLIILGGLGFAVWEDIITVRGFKNYKLHTKLVLLITAILLIFGTVAFFALEYNNPETLGPMSMKNKIMGAAFQSTTVRTAGYNTIDQAGMTEGSKFISILLMFIGGSPGSTAGGVKTVTMGILLFTVFASIHASSDVNIYGRRMKRNNIYRAVSIVLIALAAIVVATIILMIADNVTLTESLFETVSAFGTVGLTLGITPSLSIASKLALIALMFFGRIGIFTIALAFALRSKRKHRNFRYPEGDIMVG